MQFISIGITFYNNKNNKKNGENGNVIIHCTHYSQGHREKPRHS